LTQAIAKSTDSSKDVERVHQLRVNSRRMSAYIDLFTPLFSKKLQQKKIKILNFRALAGKSRDMMLYRVHLSEWQKTITPAETECLMWFMRQSSDLTKRYSKKFLKAVKKKNANDFWPRTLKSMRKSQQRSSLTIDEYLQLHLSRAIHGFTEQLRSFNPSSIEEFHDFRKQLRVFRYTMQVGADLYPDLKPIVAELQRVQDQLGYLNDLAVAAEITQKLAKNIPAEAPKTIHFGAKLLMARAQLEVERASETMPWGELSNELIHLCLSIFKAMGIKDSQSFWLVKQQTDGLEPKKVRKPLPPSEQQTTA
jgi:CHAD domain-containing protein